MESHFSVSQSLQASVILQQQQQYRTKTHRKQQQQQQQQEQEDQHLNFWQQLKLTAALFGVESSTAFEQVYTYLSLQYLGVPVALMSVNGIVAGISAMVLILVAGQLLDRGNNPKRRKIIALVFGLLLLVSGCLLIISACALKIFERLGERHNGTKFSDLNRTIFPPADGFTTSTEQQIAAGKLPDTDNADAEPSVTSLPSSPEEYLPLTGILGILGYICLDVGFDLGNPMVRAFILDNSPSSQHTHLLVTASQLQSLAGLLISCMGVFDLPGVIEAVLGVDGTAATFILMLTIILIIVISFFNCSVWTGMALRRAAIRRAATEDLSAARYKGVPGSRSRLGWRKICNSSNNSSQQQLDVGWNRKHIYRPSFERSKSSVYGQDKEDSYSLRPGTGKDISNGVDESVTVDDKTPLLFKPNISAVTDNLSYLSFSLSVASVADTEINPALSHPKPAGPTDSLGFSQSHSMLAGIPEHPSQPTPFSPVKETVNHSENGLHLDIGLSKPDETAQPPSSHVDSKTPSVELSDMKEVPQGLSSSIQAAAPSSPPAQTPLLNKRLVILILSTAFSVSSLIGVCMYSPNAVTLGIYEADPAAELGTPENLNYKKGLRTAAMGNVVFYVAYFLSSLVNNKSLKIFGEKMYFLICHGLLAIATTILVLTQRVEAYFMVMVAVGPFRTCIFTLPYILANQFTDMKAGEGPTASSRIGRVTSIIGSSLPCVYIIMSSVLGPLIDATGNVWVPLMWTCIGSTVSMAVFSVLFCVKN